MVYKKIDQSIRSEGAEYYVRAILMMEFGVITSVASRNMPGYDLIAHNINKNKNCKISVKYRTAINSDAFRFTEQIDYDFFVGIIGNRGKVGDKEIDINPAEPFKAQFFIFPRAFVLNNQIRRKKEVILKNPLRKNTPKVYRNYENKWNLITEFLEIPIKRVMKK